MLDVAGLKADLLAARKGRDKVTEVALKRVIGRIESFEAPLSAAYGAATTEVERLVITEADVLGAIRAEIEESLEAIQMYEAGGRHDAAAKLRAEAAVLQRYLRA